MKTEVRLASQNRRYSHRLPDNHIPTRIEKDSDGASNFIRLRIFVRKSENPVQKKVLS